ncbi:hypothetical protein Ahy_B05g077664 isoform B [Arachis hypogaea]|uniref:sucrose synthase n=1 Tax=Arachis hypogaea TaxID=3818 RepID=A0A444Z580_ARAHY|nr:hypothetical protein Ahy_B05g077664 isoform B [Arachis hypogaea]
MVFNVVILSPHGYFAQDNVLGYPNTGGQVVYILDQVRALENEMLNRIKKQGLDITPRILIVSPLCQIFLHSWPRLRELSDLESLGLIELMIWVLY